MKISEVKGEAALDLLADLIEPAAEILSDPKVRELAGVGNKIAIVKHLIKEHKRSVIEILAITDGVPVDEYEVNVFTIPIKLLQLFNDPELVSFFTSQGMMTTSIPSTDILENTEDQKE